VHKVLLLIAIPLLSYGFWLSDAFKGIAAGVSIFLFGMLPLEQGFKAFTLKTAVERSKSRSP